MKYQNQSIEQIQYSERQIPQERSLFINLSQSDRKIVYLKTSVGSSV